MKKLLLLMAACFVMVACGSEEKKAEKQPETVVEFVEAQVEAAKAGDVVKYVDLAEAETEFAKNLKKENAEEYKKQYDELEAWYKDKKNKESVDALNNFLAEKAQEIAAEYAKRAEAEGEGDEE